MKKVFWLAVLLFSNFIIGQKPSVLLPPDNIVTIFKNQYPDKAAIWSLEYVKDNYVNYVAEFNYGPKIKAYALYNSDGVFKFCKKQIVTTQLPPKAQKYLAQNNMVKSITQSYSVITDINEESYITGVKINKQLYRIVFDKEGEYMTRIKVNYI